MRDTLVIRSKKTHAWAIYVWAPLWAWSLAWNRPFGATGWTPTLRYWQIGPVRFSRFYEPRKLP